MFKYHDCKKKNKFNCHELSVWIHGNTVLCGRGGGEKKKKSKTKQNKTKKISFCDAL